jgi:hypothetical protein
VPRTSISRCLISNPISPPASCPITLMHPSKPARTYFSGFGPRSSPPSEAGSSKMMLNPQALTRILKGVSDEPFTLYINLATLLFSLSARRFRSRLGHYNESNSLSQADSRPSESSRAWTFVGNSVLNRVHPLLGSAMSGCSCPRPSRGPGKLTSDCRGFRAAFPSDTRDPRSKRLWQQPS